MTILSKTETKVVEIRTYDIIFKSDSGEKKHIEIRKQTTYNKDQTTTTTYHVYKAEAEKINQAEFEFLAQLIR